MASVKLGCCSGGTNQFENSYGKDTAFLKAATAVPAAEYEVRTALKSRLTRIAGGFFDMGSRQSRFPADADSPRRRIKVSPFGISPWAVTNADYASFVAATGYRTVAEVEGWSYVFHIFLSDLSKFPDCAGNAPWWRRVDGSSWQMPEGPGSCWQDRASHPAVHIAWYDALAYCHWAGLRLPYEAEWEYAARGGLQRKKFPWGNELTPGGTYAMNTWQGEFPGQNSVADGWVGTAPVDSFAPNGYGLYNMTGNVWEWVNDWFGERRTSDRLAHRDPKGPPSGTGRVQRGGSYLCHSSYCDRYHVHSRTQCEPDSSTGNCGFRVATDALDGVLSD